MPAEPWRMWAVPQRMKMELMLIPVETRQFISKESQQFKIIVLVCIKTLPISLLSSLD
jgi:hypothetical protein